MKSVFSVEYDEEDDSTEYSKACMKQVKAVLKILSCGESTGAETNLGDEHKPQEESPGVAPEKMEYNFHRGHYS